MSTPEDRIAKLAPTFVWNQPHCRATDPVVEYAVDQGDPALRSALIGAYLETTAATYRALAEGAAKAANIVSGK